MTFRLNARFEPMQRLSSLALRQVWSGIDHLTGAPVILKGTVGTEAGHRHEVLREFYLLRSLAHPALPGAVSVGNIRLPETSANEAFPGAEKGTGQTLFALIQPLIEGPSLHQLRPLSPQESRRWLTEALEIVAFLHEHRLTRLDLKPQHFIRATAGWRLIDFDQVRTFDPFADAKIHGTLAYLAPEVLAGSPGGPESDLYSLGALLYEALTGSAPPLEGTTLAELKAWFKGSRPPLLPRELKMQDATLCQMPPQLLARSPRNRFTSADEALRELTGASHWRARAPRVFQGPESLVQSQDEEAPNLSAGVPLGQAAAWERCLQALEATRAQAADTTGHAQASDAPSPLLLTAPAGAGRSYVFSTLETHLLALGLPVLRLTLRPSSAAMAQEANGDAKAPPSHQQPGPSLQPLLRWLTLLDSASSLPLPWQSSNPVRSELNGHDIRQEVSTLSPELSPAEQLQQSAQRVAGRLLTLTEGAVQRTSVPLRVLIDDAQHLDDVSRQALLKSLPQLQVSGLRVVLSLPSELPAPLPGLATTSLEPLTEADARHLCEGVLGAGAVLSRPQLQSLLALTGGWAGRLSHHLNRAWQHRGAGMEAEALAALVAPEPSPDEAVPAPNEDTLHEALARIDEQLLNGENPSPERLVQVFLAANQPARALPYLFQAVEQAVGALRYSDAERLLLGWLARVPQPARQAEPLRRLGWLALDLSQLDLAETRFRQALGACESAEQTATLQQVRARVKGGLGRVLLLKRKYAEARDRLQSALKGPLPEPLPSTLRLEVLRWWQWLAFSYRNLPSQEQPQQHLLLAEEALAQARHQNIPPRSALEVDQRYLELLIATDRGTSDEETARALTLAISLAREVGHLSGQLRLMVTQLELLRRLKRFEESIQVGEEALPLALQTFNPDQEATACWNVALSLRDVHRLGAAALQLERAARLAHRLKQPPRELQYRQELIALLLQAGRLERAGVELNLTQQLLTSQPSLANDPRSHLRQQLLVSRHTLLSGQREGLEAQLSELERSLRQLPAHILALEVACDRVLLALDAGVPAQAMAVVAGWSAYSPSADERPVWVRLHTLAIQALQQVAGLTEADSAVHHSSIHLSPAHLSPVSCESSRLESSRIESDHGDIRQHTGQNFPPGFALRAPGQDVASIVREQASFALLDKLLELLKHDTDEATLAVTIATMAGQMLNGRGLVRLMKSQEATPLVAEDNLPVSECLLATVRKEGRPLVSEDVRFDVRFKNSVSLQANPRPGVIAYPVLEANGTLAGIVAVENLASEQVKDPAVLGLLEKLAEVLGALLLTVARREEDRALARLAGSGTTVMERLDQELKTLAGSESPDLRVLLVGETGVGKSHFAERLHELSGRKGKPIHIINCASIPENLFESQVFGYKKGSFTGAIKDTPGLLEEVGEGVLCLDEVGELPLQQQSKLLTVLERLRFRRMGETEGPERPFKGWLACTTNRDLWRMVTEGLFREDLLRRIADHIVRIPSIRERGPESVRQLLPVIVHRLMVDEKRRSKNEPPPTLESLFDDRACDYLLHYAWPWNVGEMVALCRNEYLKQFLRKGARVPLEALKKVLESRELLSEPGQSRGRGRTQAGADETLIFKAGMTFWEMKTFCDQQLGMQIKRLNDSDKGDVTKTAAKLDCSRDVIYKYLRVVTEKTGERKKRKRRETKPPQTT